MYLLKQPAKRFVIGENEKLCQDLMVSVLAGVFLFYILW